MKLNNIKQTIEGPLEKLISPSTSHSSGLSSFVKGIVMCQRCLEALSEYPGIGSGDAEYFPKCDHWKMLYFIATPDLRTIKIGKSKNPLERMMVLQREERQRLILIAQYPMPNVKTEFLLHRHFNSLRISQHREWFYYRSGICAFLKLLWMTYHCGMNGGDAISLFSWQPVYGGGYAI